MKNEEKIVELLAEPLMGQDRMLTGLKGTNQRLDQTIQGLGNLENRTEKVESQLIKLNIQSVENTRAIFQLAEKVEQIADLHNRVANLEKTVYK